MREVEESMFEIDYRAIYYNETSKKDCQFKINHYICSMKQLAQSRSCVNDKDIQTSPCAVASTFDPHGGVLVFDGKDSKIIWKPPSFTPTAQLLLPIAFS